MTMISNMMSIRTMALCGAFSLVATGYVVAAQVVEERGVVYAEMASVQQVCSFLGSPALTSLADLRALDRDAYGRSFRELSATLNIWLQVKTKSVGLDDGFVAFLSTETRDELKRRFNLCYGLHSNDAAVLKVLETVFDNRDVPPSPAFIRPYFASPQIDLEAIVFMASMQDGNEYLNKYLKSTEGLLAARVAAAQQNQLPQQPAMPTDDGQSPDDDGDGLDAVLGGAPAYAQYSCEMSASQVLGVPNFNGEDKVVTAEIAVRKDGTAIINGKLLQPARLIPAAAGTDLPFSGVVYTALDVKNALFSTKGLGPGLLNPSQQELQDFETLKGIVEGLSNSQLDGRQRFLGISLSNDTIVLTDVTPDGQLANRNTPNCSRTR